MTRILSTVVFLFVLAALAAAQDIPKVINGGVLNGKAVRLPKPAYPEEVRKAGLSGLIKVKVVIDENGTVIEATATREIPENEPAETTALYNLLGEASEKAALEATFSPTRLSGQPVKVNGVITYNFVAGDELKLKGDVINGKAVELPNPEYPPAAKAVKASGAVSVRVTVDEDGNVISAEAVSGHPLLRAAATDAARLAKFRPTMINGQPAKVIGIITFNFVPPDVGGN
jgi:TonB family protein